MHLIFIRHGDPDYKNNCLTEKGKREAEILSERVSKWRIDDVYLSPYGRAQETAAPFLKKISVVPETLPWLKEFDHKITDPKTKQLRGCWDWLPDDFYSEPKFFDRRKWFDIKPMAKEKIEDKYREVCDGLDEILSRYDYTRKDEWSAIYNCFPHLTQEEASVDTHLQAIQKNLDERNLVFVCHLGVMFAMISHLTGISPVTLWQGFFVAPTSVTVLGTQERIPGEAIFRVERLGDTRHLFEAGEPSSDSGFFGHTLDV